MGRGVWAGKSKCDAMSGEKIAHGKVVKFMSIIALDGLNGKVELVVDVSVEVLDRGRSISLGTQGKCPGIVRKVIN